MKTLIALPVCAAAGWLFVGLWFTETPTQLLAFCFGVSL